MHSAEAVSGQGTSQSDSKYFHVFQNGACYEFALNITTNAAQADASLKHIDRDKLFARLESILSTVKIDPAKTDATKIDTVKIDAAKTDGAKSDGAKPGAATNDATNPATSSSDSAPANASIASDTQTAPVAASTTTATQPSSEMPPR
jgi:hypothetical protein